LVNGGVQCWGLNSSGQLGNGDTIDHTTPVAVKGLSSGVQAIAAGENHTCALVTGGVRCWGWNYDGQLGIGNRLDQSPEPMDVVNLSSGVQAIAAGDSHTCALVNGGVRCWGGNQAGQLGNGKDSDSVHPTGADQYEPVAVAGLFGPAQLITAGYGHTCAVINGIDENGFVQCWGFNSEGEIGNGKSYSDYPTLDTDELSPVGASGLFGVQAISAGRFHTCAVTFGVVECWGDYERSGNVVLRGSTVPVPVSP
jgi:alpha-tubulin suppressor-like RCC1 family protein